MDFKEVMMDPSPGELLGILDKELSEGNIDFVYSYVESLSEQSEVAELQLERFLRNISDSPGARTVVEQYYESELDTDVDASDYSALMNEVGDVDSIVFDHTLPHMGKEQLRTVYGVEGIWSDVDGGTVPYLVPEWVREHEEEPHRIYSTSGTTGKPWSVVVTRNDWALRLSQLTRFADYVCDEYDLVPEHTHAAIVIPVSMAKDVFSEAFEYIGADVEVANFDKLNSGGAEARDEAERLIRHVNQGQHGVVASAMDFLLREKMGVALRRGEIDADVYINSGRLLIESHKETVEGHGAIEDFYGESEYPQAGGMWQDKEGHMEGFQRPFEGQINVVFDEETNKIAYEGRGRIGFLPFAQEGHVIPGVYMTGVEAKLHNIDDKTQLMEDVERVEDEGRGCL